MSAQTMTFGPMTRLDESLSEMDLLRDGEVVASIKKWSEDVGATSSDWKVYEYEVECYDTDAEATFGVEDHGSARAALAAAQRFAMANA